MFRDRFELLSKAGLQFLRGLRAHKVRRAEGATLIEGVRLVETALDAGATMRWFVVDPCMEEDPDARRVVERLAGEGVRGTWLHGERFASFSHTRTPQGLAAVADWLPADLDEVLAGAGTVLLADRIQDPGNLGAIIRSALYFGAGGVVLSGGCCEGDNPRVVRGSAGATFEVPVAGGADLQEVVRTLAIRGYLVFGTAAQGGDDPSGIEFPRQSAFLLGNEGAGARADLLAACHRVVTIRGAGSGGSLNVAVAAGILLEHARDGARS